MMLTGDILILHRYILFLYDQFQTYRHSFIINIKGYLLSSIFSFLHTFSNNILTYIKEIVLSMTNLISLFILMLLKSFLYTLLHVFCSCTLDSTISTSFYIFLLAFYRMTKIQHFVLILLQQQKFCNRYLFI